MSDTAAAAGCRHSEPEYHIFPECMQPTSVRDDPSHHISLYLCLVICYYQGLDLSLLECVYCCYILMMIIIIPEPNLVWVQEHCLYSMPSCPEG